MVTLHRVGGVDNAANIGRIIEEGGEFRPVGLPGSDRSGVLATPGFSQALQVDVGLLAGRGLVDRLEVSDEGLAVFP